MSMQAHQGMSALTEKEKQTLRLLVRGHDAKSSARSLGLSVHTVNERLRDARRKLAVSSSREAARLLLAAEGETLPVPRPDSVGDTQMGEASGQGDGDDAARRARRPLRIIIGVTIMTFAIGLLALAALPHLAPDAPSAPDTHSTAHDAAMVDTARRFLVLLDQGQWDESYRMTGSAFRELNTAETWATVSQRVRAPLGSAMSRTFLSQENLPAPPAGYEVLKFRTRFANGTEAVETVTLDREDGGWHIVGITIG